MELKSNDDISFKLEKISSNKNLLEILLPEIMKHEVLIIENNNDHYLIKCNKKCEEKKLTCKSKRYVYKKTYKIDEDKLLIKLKIILKDYKLNKEMNIENRINHLIKDVMEGNINE